jgi:tyrosine-protein phosphatase SIW14
MKSSPCFFILVFVILLVALLPNASAAPPQTEQETQTQAMHAVGKKLNQKGVLNFGEVTPTLYRGGLLKPGGLKALKKLGIEVVVDTHANDTGEEKEVQKLGMSYVAIPWHCPWPHDEVFAKFLKVVHENQGKKIFVHCRLGDDRTGMMVAAYRMAEQGWSADEAMNEMRSFGFTASHHLICPSLARYERSFPRRLRNDPVFKGLVVKAEPETSN